MVNTACLECSWFKLLYAMTVDEISVQLKPSKAWKKLRTTTEGKLTMKNMMYQVVVAKFRVVWN
jgi:hypothetical protein